jgi:hypothetical protein
METAAFETGHSDVLGNYNISTNTFRHYELVFQDITKRIRMCFSN